MAKVELNYSMDACERLKNEIQAEDRPMCKIIGNYLLEKMKSDNVLKSCYFDRKITLKSICDYVVECAKHKLNNQNGAVEDKEVFGWVLHYVQDEKVGISKDDKLTLDVKTKEEIEQKAKEDYYRQVQADLKKQEEKKTAKENSKIEKAKKKRQDEGYMDLFDMGD